MFNKLVIIIITIIIINNCKQFSQNQMFANDRKTFFRNLGKDQISVEKPPKKEITETF